LTREGADAFGYVRMTFKISINIRSSLRFKNTIHIGVEIFFRDGPIIHFMLLNFTTFLDASSAVPSISCCNLSRARERRDITVPIGISRTLAASATDDSAIER